MKKIAIILTALIFSAYTAKSIEDFHFLSAGPYFSLKTGVNGAPIPDGRKTGIAFVGIPDFGVSVFYPVGQESDLGMTFDLGYSSYAYQIKGVNVDASYTFRYSYISLAGNAHFNGFLAGFNVGYPVNATFGEYIDPSDLNVMVELRLGWMYPLLLDEDGSLNVFIQAGYMLTSFYDDFPTDDPVKEFIPPTPSDPLTNKYNPRAVSLLVGLSYLINI